VLIFTPLQTLLKYPQDVFVGLSGKKRFLFPEARAWVPDWPGLERDTKAANPKNAANLRPVCNLRRQ
jgi:hypothetical protein